MNQYRDTQRHWSQQGQQNHDSQWDQEGQWVQQGQRNRRRHWDQQGKSDQQGQWNHQLQWGQQRQRGQVGQRGQGRQRCQDRQSYQERQRKHKGQRENGQDLFSANEVTHWHSLLKDYEDKVSVSDTAENQTYRPSSGDRDENLNYQACSGDTAKSITENQGWINLSQNWECPNCQFSNYSTRKFCYKCRTENHTNRSFSSNRNHNWSKSGQNWECPNCQFSNYSNRVYCYKCKDPKESRSFTNSQQWKNEEIGNKKTDESYGSCYNEPEEEGLIDWDKFHEESNRAEAERWAALPPIKKNLYIEDSTVKAMSDLDVQTFREKNFNMTVSHLGSDNSIPIPNPVNTFKQAFGPYPELLAEIKRQSFEQPTPIQSQAWPILMQGYDMIGIAQTGTGKTLAYILPALLHVVAQSTPRKKRFGPTCLVIAPTRELAQQIEKEVSKYQYKNIKCVAVYGQGDKHLQIDGINSKAEVVVATPGRLNDFVDQDIIDLRGVSYMVLDEADRMLDMGFEPQIRKIKLDIRPDCQIVMTSATWPECVRELAQKFTTDPILVVVGSLDLQPVYTVTQHVIICRMEEKTDKLLEFVRTLPREDKAIVFIGKKNTVEELSVQMILEGLPVQSMHGGRAQEDREEALNDLKIGKVNVLLATDVASRGIDITDITHIFNYDCPRDMEEYVHRIGRTGRAGRLGCAYTLFTQADRRKAGRLVKVLEKSNQEVNPYLYKMMETPVSVQGTQGQQNRTSRYGNKGYRYQL
ncbi:probable ATP-dependent RNA helicase DDX43 [Panulirus ornatus]|uniref:probable ATP-dependent RNA helicase DDX43 n=1 Tax=Panulirus ornatus TaxID=150431 RepID=UPI003A84E9A0